MKLTKDKRVMYSLFIIVTYAVFIGLVSYFTGWTADDALYAFSFASPGWSTPIASLSDIVESQNAHYYLINGRYSTHFLVQFFCGMAGHLPFAVCNSLFYVLFILMLARLGRVTLANVQGILTVVVLTGITFQTKMTPSYQISYIWIYVLDMLFLWLFLNRYRTNNILIYIVLAAFSCICGNGQESLSVGIGGALIIYWIVNRRRMTPAQYVMMITFGTGALACCLSPAALLRARSASGTFMQSLPLMMYSLTSLVAIYILLIVLIWHVWRKKEKFRMIYKVGMFYWNAMFVLLAFILVIGVESNRQCFGIELMSLVLVLRLLPKHTFTLVWLAIAGVYFVIINAVGAVVDYRHWSSCREVDRQYCTSNDGRVYLDLKSDGILNLAKFVRYELEYSRSLIVYRKNLHEQNLSSTEENLNKKLRLLCPGKPDITIIPAFLQGKDKTVIGDTIITLDKGTHLLIQSKHEPAKFYVRRTPKFFFTNRGAGVEQLPFDIPSYEGEHWKALVVYDNCFPSFNYTCQHFYIEKD